MRGKGEEVSEVNLGSSQHIEADLLSIRVALDHSLCTGDWSYANSCMCKCVGVRPIVTIKDKERTMIMHMQRKAFQAMKNITIFTGMS